MINFSNETKAMYKNYDRRLSVYGNLYLAQKRLSKNLIDITEKNEYNFVLSNNLKPNTNYSLSFEGGPIYYNIRTEAGGTILISSVHENYCTFTTDSTGKAYFNGWNGTFPLTNFMLVEGEPLPYEEYGTMVNDYTLFQLTEENECKILGFNINEKADIYYTSLPYNTMTIEVDNEKGYFTDYTQNSIVTLLNSDCYVDLFMKINDDGYYKIMTMNFDKVSSSDYEKAKLSFKSCISYLKTLQLKDKDYKFFSKNSASSNDIENYFKNNYNLVVKKYNEFGLNLTALRFLKTPEDLLLHTILNELLTTNYNNEIIYKDIFLAFEDIISQDMQLEKPVVKRENTYQAIKYIYDSQIGYSNQNKQYKKEIRGNLISKKDTIVINDYNYKMNEITINDITHSNNITLVLHVNEDVNNVIVLEISGNIGAEYTININNNDLPYLDTVDKNEYIEGYVTDTSKILQVNETFSTSLIYYYYLFKENSIRTNIEVKLMGLPYLEIGDIIQIENDLSMSTIVITAIDMNFDGGLTMTIKGYEFATDNLLPADDLYPSDTLYPNTRL